MKNIQFIVDNLFNYREYIKSILVIAISIAALVNDLKYFKIPNKLNLTFIVAGLLLNACLGNVKLALAGMAFPMILFPLFAVRMMGAGDIKLFCAVGAIVGFPNIVSIICYSVIFNGIIAVLLLIFRKEKGGFAHIVEWLKCCFFNSRIVKYQSLDKKNRNIFRYAYGIFLGCICYVIADLVLGGWNVLL